MKRNRVSPLIEVQRTAAETDTPSLLDHQSADRILVALLLAARLAAAPACLAGHMCLCICVWHIISIIIIRVLCPIGLCVGGVIK